MSPERSYRAEIASSFDDEVSDDWLFDDDEASDADTDTDTDTDNA